MQDMGKIYIEPNELSSKIEQLKMERDNMSQILTSIETDAKNMINFWSGTVGEEAYERVNTYTKTFPSIIKQINSYIAFLEEVIYSYKEMDAAIENKMEENSSVSAI